jgi:hypothetical protein
MKFEINLRKMGTVGELRQYVGRMLGIAKERVMVFLSTQKMFGYGLEDGVGLEKMGKKG